MHPEYGSSSTVVPMESQDMEVIVNSLDKNFVVCGKEMSTPFIPQPRFSNVPIGCQFGRRRETLGEWLNIEDIGRRLSNPARWWHQS